MSFEDIDTKKYPMLPQTCYLTYVNCRKLKSDKKHIVEETHSDPLILDGHTQ